MTNRLFGRMPLLSCCLAPRPRDLSDPKRYVPLTSLAYELWLPLVGETLNMRPILAYRGEMLRLAMFSKQGTVPASRCRRKRGRFSRQNGSAVTLREPGRLERSLIRLKWLQSVQLRRRVQARLYKGEACPGSSGPCSFPG